jgi:hypothetical protein
MGFIKAPKNFQVLPILIQTIKAILVESSASGASIQPAARIASPPDGFQIL